MRGKFQYVHVAKMLRYKIQKHQFIWPFLDKWETAYLFYSNFSCSDFVKAGFDASEDSVEIDIPLLWRTRKGGLLVHNHPNGVLRPSEEDWELATDPLLSRLDVEFAIITPELRMILFKIENGAKLIRPV